MTARWRKLKIIVVKFIGTDKEFDFHLKKYSNAQIYVFVEMLFWIGWNYLKLLYKIKLTNHLFFRLQWIGKP
jgi:hypothetical protein